MVQRFAGGVEQAEGRPQRLTYCDVIVGDSALEGRKLDLIEIRLGVDRRVNPMAGDHCSFQDDLYFQIDLQERCAFDALIIGLKDAGST